MKAREILQEGIAILSNNPGMATQANICNLLIAARMTWEVEEMGGIEHRQFANRNNTPIVPIGHECHPIELIKRGYIDGIGWPKENRDKRINITRWPEGKHWYATVDGIEVTENGVNKWNTYMSAEKAAKRFMESK